MRKMSTREKLKEEMQLIPDDLLGELHAYMKYLKYKKSQSSSPAGTGSMETAYASDAVLGRDWNSPEEDKAWQDL